MHRCRTTTCMYQYNTSMCSFTDGISNVLLGNTSCAVVVW
jgi:hypothetical protein